jgi:hypothetical protein
MKFYIKKNDTSPAILATLKDADDIPVNLNGASVRFHLRTISSRTVKVDEAAAVVASEDGLVRYDWQAQDTDVIGSYQAEFEVTYSDASVETFPNDGYIRVEVVGDIA